MNSPGESDPFTQLTYNADGLIPAIIQEHQTGKILMMAWMNKTSLRRSLESGRTHFWSRSRQQYWMKGETSGHVQTIRQIAFDCDGDTLLIQVEQQGNACHKNYHSCFYRAIDSNRRIVFLDEIRQSPLKNCQPSTPS